MYKTIDFDYGNQEALQTSLKEERQEEVKQAARDRARHIKYQRMQEAMLQDGRVEGGQLGLAGSAGANGARGPVLQNYYNDAYSAYGLADCKITK